MTETSLGLARRHVAEGRGRIQRQQALVLRLIANGHDELVPEGRAFLAALQQSQKLAEAHLASEERDAVRPFDSQN